MNHPVNRPTLAAVLLAGACVLPACGSSDPKAADARTAAVPAAAVAVSPVAAVEQPITRFIRATGSLMAEEQADVAAEIAGRVVATPVAESCPMLPNTIACTLTAVPLRPVMRSMRRY